MPVSIGEKLAALRRDVGSQRRLAELLGVDQTLLARWQDGQALDEAAATRVDLLEFVMAHLLRVYPVAAAQRWLVGTNPHLGDRRPIDVIRSGQIRPLLDAIAIERAGTFA